MTPEEFAEQAGLSLEEARFILARRAAAEAVPPGGRHKLAQLALQAAQKKVGVHPVVVEGGWIEKEHDPEAEEGFLSFYKDKGPWPDGRPKRRLNAQPVAVEDQSQDEGWEP